MKGSPEILLSKEGTTQGDPLAMLMYGIGMLPLNKELSEILILAIQIWYADDSGCVGRLKEIRKWFDLLMEKGPNCGYFPEPFNVILQQNILGIWELKQYMLQDIWEDLLEGKVKFVNLLKLKWKYGKDV